MIERLEPCENESLYWEKWLPTLGTRCDGIRENVKKLLRAKQATPQLPHYTIHNCDHFQAVEDLIHRLLPREMYTHLSESERFFLLASAWLHDIGMIRGILDGDDNRDHHEIRSAHHLRSEEHITSNYLALGIEESEANVFGTLARFHRRRCPIFECDESITIAEHGSIRLRLLAAYLRLADALHIDYTRAPSTQYAISLTYDIPRSSKIHWLKSRFVLGMDIDVREKRIFIHFRSPIKEDTDTTMRQTLRSVFDVIVRDLQDELDSVKNVLFSAGLSYFLDVVPIVHEFKLEKQFNRDIKTVLNYYFLLDNPSSSALQRLMLESVQGIADSNPLVLAQEIENFLKEVKENVLSERRCHIGLHHLVHGLEALMVKVQQAGEVSPDVPPETRRVSLQKEVSEWVAHTLEDLRKKRRGVRHQAADFFSSHLGERGGGALIDGLGKEKKQVNVLLYGYSELVIKSICGFRDVVLKDLLSQCSAALADQKETERSHSLYKEDFERTASDCFSLFVCEGQPKNQVTWGSRVIYHDGMRYAQALAKCGFRKICVVPDACSGTLLLPRLNEPPLIDFVMVGANGFDKEKFAHSAGHGMAVALTRYSTIVAESRGTAEHKLLLVLAVTADKNGTIDVTKKRTPDAVKEGWRFHGSFRGEMVRMQPFFAQDNKLYDTLRDDAQSVAFYNPREDIIPFDEVDVVITEEQWVRQDGQTKIEWNGHRFIKVPVLLEPRNRSKLRKPSGQS